jgi:hypothetical protein
LFAYLLSAIFAGVSIFFILVQGISFGNEKVQKWITSLLFSMLSSVFLTQPIQVTLTAIFFVSVFRKATDFYKENTEKKEIEESDNVDEQKAHNLRPGNFQIDRLLPSADVDLKEIRLDRLKQQKLKNILKKALLHSIFLWILFVTAFSNRDLNSYKYQFSLKQSIGYVTNKAMSINNVISIC